MKFKEVPESSTLKKLLFMCPGCNEEHAIDWRWQFNGDFDKPTIAPSFKIEGARFIGSTEKQERFLCHSFIRLGRIEFLNDCTHKLKGQTVDLPDYEPRPR